MAGNATSDADAQARFNSFYGAPSTRMTKAAFTQAVSDYVRDLYAAGGYLLDRQGKPILTFEEVEIVVRMTAHTLTADAVRKGKPMRHEITREMFIAATGREPRHDDLERCNCPHAGLFGHWCCGWNAEHNRPQFEIGPAENIRHDQTH